MHIAATLMGSSSMSLKNRRNVLIAAGGTGGHILPAIALGQALISAHNLEVVYVCGERPIELDLYRRHGIEPVVLPARQLGQSLLTRAIGLLRSAEIVLRCLRLLRQREIGGVIGMGGYVSGPAVLAGILKGLPTVIHEANAVPGKTNKWLAPWVTVSAVNFEKTCSLLRARRCVRVGMPLRAGVVGGNRAQALDDFDLDPRRRTLLVLGGSQGARNFYRAFMEALPALDSDEFSDLQLLWSTGSGNFTELKEKLEQLNLRYIKVRLLPFIERMDLALACADAAISRAGASTLAELLANGVYALYVPLPTAIYDHQRINAEELVKAGLGRMLLEKDLTPENVSLELRNLFREAPYHRERVRKAGEFHAHAAERLAQIVDQLLCQRLTT